MNVINLSTGQGLGNNIQPADTFFKRLLGLLFKKKLDSGEGIVLNPCNMIHTFGMKISLDIAFLSDDNRVLNVLQNLGPNRVGKGVKGTSKVLELPAGTIESTGTVSGDRLSIY